MRHITMLKEITRNGAFQCFEIALIDLQILKNVFLDVMNLKDKITKYEIRTHRDNVLRVA